MPLSYTARRSASKSVAQRPQTQFSEVTKSPATQSSAVPVLSSRDYDCVLKLLIVGDAGVGKTNLLSKYTDDVFTTASIATIGVDFVFHDLLLDNKRIKLQIFNNLPNWIDDLRRYGISEMPIVIVGNKSDLHDNRAVPFSEAKAFADSLGMAYVEASAKTGSSVAEAFITNTKTMMSHSPINDLPRRQLPDTTPVVRNKWGWCSIL